MLAAKAALKTTNQTYLVFLADYPVDEIEPDNSGLYTLKIIKETDESKLTGTWEDWTIPGIYVSEQVDLPENVPLLYGGKFDHDFYCPCFFGPLVGYAVFSVLLTETLPWLYGYQILCILQ